MRSSTAEVRPVGIVGSLFKRDFKTSADYHQQYLVKNPNGYRCHSATGVPVPR